MSPLFSILQIIICLLTSCSIWAINLKIRRSERFCRTIVLFGPLILFGMFIYSLYFIKGVHHAWFLTILLSLGTTIAWIFAGCMIIGILIILSVGSYWLTVTLRNTNYEAFRRRFRRDFSHGWRQIKAWIEGEN